MDIFVLYPIDRQTKSIMYVDMFTFYVHDNTKRNAQIFY